MSPAVTFVVPCYRLAHLLPDCVESILAQSYRDFEVLIMDDCSPDDTPGVASTFRDARVRHVRNDQNLGHLRNFNKGIGLARGRYLWLISADDRLRRPYALQRFVETLEAHPRAGFVLCPALELQGQTETSVGPSHGSADAIFKGPDFLSKLVWGNCVSAPAAMARTDCYRRAGLFPLDLPFTGDWYLWSAFALDADVAYVAEPLANRRIHELNLTWYYRERAPLLVSNEVATRWRVRSLAQASGRASVAKLYLDVIATDYARRMARKAAENWAYGLTPDEFEQSLRHHLPSHGQRATMRSMVYCALGDRHISRRDLQQARQAYARAVREDRRNGHAWAKYALARMGRSGIRIRAAVAALRRPDPSRRSTVTTGDHADPG